MAGNGGPWGGGDDDRDDRNRGNSNGPQNGPGRRRPSDPVPEIDEIMRKGQEQLRVLMGGRGRGTPPGGGGGGAGGPILTRQGLALGVLGVAALWAFASFYTVDPGEQSVELAFGKFYRVGEPGLNFAPWPVVSAIVLPVKTEQQTMVGAGAVPGSEDGLMLTRDQNIVDIGFQVVWNIADPAKYLFNLADAEDTIRAVSESAMRDIIARSELSPILNRDRGTIAEDLRKAVQATLDSYDSGINVIRVNLQQAAPPAEVIDSFRDVAAAQQERDRLQKEADAYANKVTAGARGDAARIVQEAEAYRAQTVNEAQGDASRFSAVRTEYAKAPDVTRRRLYLETMERVLGGANKVVMDQQPGQGAATLPLLPLTDLLGKTGPAPDAAKTGGNN